MEAIATAEAPAAIGPYSQAIAWNQLIFASGQIPLDPVTGQLVEGDISAQTNRVLDNLAAVLAAAGGGFDTVLKTTIYLADMAHFAEMNQVYGARFTGTPPARSTVQAARLPRDAMVEIDVIAYRR